MASQTATTHTRPDGYPWNWEEISLRVKQQNNWRCQRCHRPHLTHTDRALQVHHLDHNPANCADWNLAALCQRCHKYIQDMNLHQLAALRFQRTMWGVNENWLANHLPGILNALRSREG